MVDWTLDKRGGTREDTVLFADAQARIGVAGHAEMQIGWTAYGHRRTRDQVATEATGSAGDVRLAVRRNLRHPDGHGLSVSLEPYVALPTGGRAVGAGDWGYGLVVPVNYDLSDRASLQVNGTVDAAVDGDRSGRHLSYSGTAGLGYALTASFVTVAEVEVVADADPAGRTTRSTAALSFAYLPKKTWQLDVLVGIALNRDTPDLRLGFGGAILF